MLAKKFRFTPPIGFSREATRYDAGKVLFFVKFSPSFACAASITKQNSTLAIARNRVKRQLFAQVGNILEQNEIPPPLQILLRVKGRVSKDGLSEPEVQEFGKKLQQTCLKVSGTINAHE